MAPLVEASHDRRLGERETASLERHLEGCSACRDRQAALRELREIAPRAVEIAELSPLEHRRRRLSLLRAAAMPRATEGSATSPPPRPRRSAAWLAAAALIATVAVLVMWARHPADAPPPAELSEASTAPMPRTEPSAPPSAAVVSSIRAQVTEAPGSVVKRSTLREGGSDIERVELHDGAIEVSVGNLSGGQRFVVATGDGEVEVRGTRFSVLVDDGHLREVRVDEGRVELRYGGESKMLEVGDVWRAPRAATSSQSAASLGVPVPPPSGASAFADAIAKLEAGDYATAGAAFQGFAEQHPSDPMAEDADYLVIISFQRAGRGDEANAAARRYLERYPTGSRRAEIEAMIGGDKSL